MASTRGLILVSLVAWLAAGALRATDGALDPTFCGAGTCRVAFDLPGSSFADHAAAVAVDRDGRIVVAGTVDDGTLGTDCGVARLLPDGSLDTSFGGTGLVTWDLSPQFTFNDTCSDVAIAWGPGLALDGPVIATGTDGQGRIHVHQFPEATGFGIPVAHDTEPQIALEPAFDKIYLAWSDGDFQVCRYLDLAGTLDVLFGNQGCTSVAFDLGGGLNDDLYDMALQTDGKVLLVGSAEWGGGDADFAIARLDSGGALDSSFGAGGKLSIPFDLNTSYPDFARSVAVAEDGTIYVAGNAGTGFLTSQAALAKVAPDGSGYATLHFLFGPSSTSGLAGVVVQDDGKIVVAGASTTTGNTDFSSARLLPNLSPDPDFSGGVVEFDPNVGGADFAVGLALDGGRAVLAGSAEWSAPDFDFAVMRLQSTLIFADGFDTGYFDDWSFVGR